MKKRAPFGPAQVRFISRAIGGGMVEPGKIEDWIGPRGALLGAVVTDGRGETKSRMAVLRRLEKTGFYSIEKRLVTEKGYIAYHERLAARRGAE